MGDADFFGHIALSRAERGMFGVFYDFSTSRNNTITMDTSADYKQGVHSSHILVTTISGEALNEFQRCSDSEIVSRCVATLRRMFPQDSVPDPLQSIVSRWGDDPFAQMSYSYAAVGSSGEDYDVMAEEMRDAIFFAGEVRVCTWPSAGVTCQHSV